MIMNNPGPVFFEATPEDEYRLTFFARNPLLASGREPLMTMRCFEEDKLRGAIVWLGERQDLWTEWAQIARDKGGNELSAHIVDLTIEDSTARYGSPNYMFELCLGARVECVGSDKLKLILDLTTRQLTIAQYTFMSRHQRNAFMTAVASPDRRFGLVELGELALLRGRNAFRTEFERIVNEAASVHGGTVH